VTDPDGVADLVHRHGLEVDIAVTDNTEFRSIKLDCRADQGDANKNLRGLGYDAEYAVNRIKSQADINRSGITNLDEVDVGDGFPSFEVLACGGQKLSSNEALKAERRFREINGRGAALSDLTTRCAKGRAAPFDVIEHETSLSLGHQTKLRHAK